MRFSFGRNWDEFLRHSFSRERVAVAKRSMQEFLGRETLTGQSVIDVGCGSGLFSLAAYELGASSLRSFDVDPLSVRCCERLHETAGSPNHWTIARGSILDRAFVETIPPADIVYSWGVLHHTGDMWNAIANAASLVRPGGAFYISIYNDVPGLLGSRTWVTIKRVYNASPRPLQFAMESAWMALALARELAQGRNPIEKVRGYQSHRGMRWRTDIIDWFGGYPYEYATTDAVTAFCTERCRLTPVQVRRTASLGTNEFLFQRSV